MRLWTITLPLPTPSLNVTKRIHWTVESRMKRDWYYILRAAEGFGAIPIAVGFRKVHIERHSPMELDKDNFHGGCKALTDLLKPPTTYITKAGKLCGRIGFGLILEDDSKHVEVTFSQVKSTKAGAKTVITISEEM